MFKPINPLPAVASGFAIALGLVVADTATAVTRPVAPTPSPSTLSNSQILSTPSINRTWTISQSFKPRTNIGAPRSTAGGATRGSSCLKGKSQLTSLMPQSRLGLTFSGNPTFYWYVPQSPAQTAKFLLLNSDDSDVVYETDFALPRKGGIVSLKLPQTVKPLEVNQQYHWYLVLGCSETDQSANPSVEGWVQRITPDAMLVKKLQETTGKNRAIVYADNGIWHEALMTLASLRRNNPKDAQVMAGWQELLRSVGLSAIAVEPLLDSNLSQN